uniref:Uncharacterized protein n=1 Tax=Parascaris equorum TaxID=6256 RepID=A0A914S9E4_PAREQ
LPDIARNFLGDVEIALIRLKLGGIDSWFANLEHFVFFFSFFRCIIAAENNFPATPPCLEMIEEKPLSYERSFGSIACFKCDHFPIFYISDEFSLIVHLVQVHMTDVDNEILDFLDER